MRQLIKAAGHASVILLAGGLFLTPRAGADTGQGQEIFTKSCVACHGSNGGGMPGSGANLTDECFLNGGSEAEIQAVIAYGSQNNPAMIGWEPIIGPDGVQAVTQYVYGLIGTNVAGGQSCQKGTGTAASAGTGDPVLEGDIDRGSKLFQGLIRFENGGPSCISCHTVRNDAVISGGSLGKDITDKVTEASGAMVKGFVQSKPVMQQAFADRPLTEQEKADLAAFLADTYEKGQSMPGDTGIKLALSGVAGTVLLLGLYTMLWGRRKRFSVNRDIYDRQIKSSDL